MKYLLFLTSLLIFSISLSAQTKNVQASSQPSFSVVAMDGTKIDTAALKGKVIVVNLWFINCPNCREEIKLLNQLVDQYKGKDVVFVGLAASKKADLEKFLAKYPFRYHVVPSAEMIMFRHFATPDKKGEINIPFPMHFVLDRSGNIVVRAQGIKGIDAVKTELVKQFPGNTATAK